MGKAGPGYKKPKTKKYFTKKDIISTSVVAAIVIIAVIVLGVVISRDDFIRTKDGRLEMEDNWLISNYSNTSKTMYYKVGEIGDVEGYTLGAGSAQSPIKVLTADDENAPVSTVYLGTFEHNYTTAAEAMVEYYTETTGPIDTTIAGRSAKYITSFSAAEGTTEETSEEASEEVPAEEAAEETPAEEPAEETAEEAPAEETADEAEAAEETVAVESPYAAEDIFVLIAYVDYDEDHCIYIQLTGNQELTTEEIDAHLAKISDRITLVER